MVSLLSAGKVVQLIFTLNRVSSRMSQSDASKGNDSTRSRIALAVALPRVEEPCDAVEDARLRRPHLALRVRGGAHVHAFECGLSPPLRKENLHFLHTLNPAKESFAAICVLGDWVSTVRISRRRWISRRALEGKAVAHIYRAAEVLGVGKRVIYDGGLERYGCLVGVCRVL